MKKLLSPVFSIMLLVFFYSCGKSPEEKIIGKWLPINGKGILELTKDGTFLMTVDTNLISARYKFLDDGKVLIEYLNGVSAKKISIRFSEDDNKMFVLDETNNKSQNLLRIDNLPYSEYGDFFDGLAKVKKGNKYGFIDTLGEMKIEAKYEAVNNFNEGLSKVKSGINYGFIDTSGKEIVPIQYPNIEYVFEGEFTEEKVLGCLFLATEANTNALGHLWVEYLEGKTPIHPNSWETLTAKISMFDSIDFNNYQHYILVTSCKSKYLEISTDLLFGAYVFLKSSNRFFLIIRDDLLWVAPTTAKPKLLKTGDVKLGLVFDWWASGISGFSSKTRTIFAEFEDGFSRAINIKNKKNSLDGNSTDEQDLTFDMVYRFVINPNSDYYDLVFDKSVANYDPESGKIVIINSNDSCHFYNGLYVKN